MSWWKPRGLGGAGKGTPVKAPDVSLPKGLGVNVKPGRGLGLSEVGSEKLTVSPPHPHPHQHRGSRVLNLYSHTHVYITHIPHTHKYTHNTHIYTTYTNTYIHIHTHAHTYQHTQTYTAAVAAAKLLQSCPTLYDPIDGSPPGSPVPGILQARTLEWVVISFSRA